MKAAIGITLLMAAAMGTAERAEACPQTWRAEQWVERHKDTSFALRCQGEVKSSRGLRISNSASTGKALLLVAHLREKRPVTPVRGDLRAMITQSDNQAASRTYARLGDRPLRRALRRMGMYKTRLCSCWASIRWSPKEYSKLFMSLPEAIPSRQRKFAMSLFKGVTPSQRWGIPRAARRYGYRSYLKGGWRPEAGGWIVLQGALLRKGKGRIGLAVFTRNQPSLEAGARKIEKITSLLLKPRKAKVPPAPKAAERGWSSLEPPRIWA